MIYATTNPPSYGPHILSPRSQRSLDSTPHRLIDIPPRRNTTQRPPDPSRDIIVGPGSVLFFSRNVHDLEAFGNVKKHDADVREDWRGSRRTRGVRLE